MNYRLLLIDADNTLLDYDAAEIAAFRKSFEEKELAYRPEFHRLYREINARVWEEFEAGAITQKDLRVKRYRLLFDEIGIDIDPASFSRGYLENLAQGSQLLAGARPFLNKLQERFRLVLITNGISVIQHSRLELAGIKPCFEAIIISEEVGVPKPEPGIFEAAFRAAGHSAKESALIIGDSLTSDMRGGQRFGIDTCWFNPDGKENRQEDVRPTYEKRTLHDIETMLLGG